MTSSLMRAIIASWDTDDQCQTYEDKKLRENLSEDQIDDMIDNTFPASDPPSTY